VQKARFGGLFAFFTTPISVCYFVSPVFVQLNKAFCCQVWLIFGEYETIHRDVTSFLFV
jgi:hypothetical protein